MYYIFSFLSLVVPILISIAYLTLAERKIMASMQKRKGPNVVGIFGLLQPLADGLKLIKETVFPSSSNLIVFFCSPVLTFFLSISGWMFIPLNAYGSIIDIDVSTLFLLAISSLSVYGIICSGWSSNSKYAFLGALRSAAQMISYEISVGLIIMTILVVVGTSNLHSIIFFQKYNFWLFLPLFPAFIMFFISTLAETNRAPFDLPEAESELVAGYNTEYSALGFALFFLGEYSNMILMSSITTIFFLGGYLPFFKESLFYYIPQSFWFASKVIMLLFFFVWIRASLPRKRYDQLMFLGWKIFLPTSLAILFMNACFLIFVDGLP
nr:Nad1 [Porphyridium purpureum]